MDALLRADKHGQLIARVQGLKGGAIYVARVMTSTRNGDSAWSDTVAVAMGDSGGAENLIQLPPRL